MASGRGPRTVAFEIDEDVLARLDEAAARLGATRNGVIRDALRRFLARAASPGDVRLAPKPSSPRRRLVSFKGDRELMAALREAAARLGVSVSDVVRSAIADFLSSQAGQPGQR